MRQPETMQVIVSTPPEATGQPGDPYRASGAERRRPTLTIRWSARRWPVVLFAWYMTVGISAGTINELVSRAFTARSAALAAIAFVALSLAVWLTSRRHFIRVTQDELVVRNSFARPRRYALAQISQIHVVRSSNRFSVNIDATELVAFGNSEEARWIRHRVSKHLGIEDRPVAVEVRR